MKNLHNIEQKKLDFPALFLQIAGMSIPIALISHFSVNLYIISKIRDMKTWGKFLISSPHLPCILIPAYENKLLTENRSNLLPTSTHTTRFRIIKPARIAVPKNQYP